MINRNVIGCAESAQVQSGIAITAHIEENQEIFHANLSSRTGYFHADANVGMEPINDIARLITIPYTGLLDMYQTRILAKALQRQNLSSLVQPGILHFSDKKKTNHDPIPATRIWLFSAPSTYIPEIVMVSRVAHISHEAFVGFVFFCKIATI